MDYLIKVNTVKCGLTTKRRTFFKTFATYFNELNRDPVFHSISIDKKGRVEAFNVHYRDVFIELTKEK